MLIKSKKEIAAAIAYLKKNESKMPMLIKHYGLPRSAKYGSYFEALTKAIIYQQLAGKAAMKICQRFVALYETNGYPTPELVTKSTIKKMRSAGLSERKAEYIKGISKTFIEDNWSPSSIRKMSDEELREKLTAIKGIGNWTADMFLMNCLRRSDILAVDDYGIKRGFQFMYSKKDLPDNDYMIKKAKPWQPYRSIMAYYLWSLANDGISFRKLSKKADEIKQLVS